MTGIPKNIYWFMYMAGLFKKAYTHEQNLLKPLEIRLKIQVGSFLTARTVIEN